MSDPYTHQGVGRMFPGSLGGRSRVASPVSPVPRQKFTYPAAPVPAGPFWYGFDTFATEIDRFDFPTGDNSTAIVSGLPLSGTDRVVYMCGTGSRLYWLEVTDENIIPTYYLYTVPMAGGTPSMIWTTTLTPGVDTNHATIKKIFADPVNHRVLIPMITNDNSVDPTAITEDLLAVDSGGTVTTVFSRTDDAFSSGAGHSQLFNGVNSSGNLFVVVASDGNIWGIEQHSTGYGLWYYDGSSFTMATLPWTPRLIAPSLGGWIRVQKQDLPQHVYGADPTHMTPVALACAADDFLTNSVADGYGVPDGYGKVVYWSSISPTVGSWVLTGTANGCATQADTFRFGNFGAISNNV